MELGVGVTVNPFIHQAKFELRTLELAGQGGSHLSLRTRENTAGWGKS